MYDILINSKPFKVTTDYISGAEIKKLGAIPASHKLYFHPRGIAKGIEIGDGDSVDLTRPGAEQFISKPAK
jgi:hypothetical protein